MFRWVRRLRAAPANTPGVTTLAPLRDNEGAAHALAAQLRAAGIDARVSGDLGYWQVDVGPVGPRALTVQCVWYERAESGLVLGMNPGNARSRQRRVYAPYEGPEYLALLIDDGTCNARGRTRVAEDVIACARAWFSGLTLDQLASKVSFVDEEPRALRALTAQIDAQLRWDIGEGPVYELWVYGKDRSCRIDSIEGAVFCSFLLRTAQVRSRVQSVKSARPSRRGSSTGSRCGTWLRA